MNTQIEVKETYKNDELLNGLNENLIKDLQDIEAKEIIKSIRNKPREDISFKLKKLKGLILLTYLILIKNIKDKELLNKKINLLENRIEMTSLWINFVISNYENPEDNSENERDVVWVWLKADDYYTSLESIKSDLTEITDTLNFFNKIIIKESLLNVTERYQSKKSSQKKTQETKRISI